MVVYEHHEILSFRLVNSIQKFLFEIFTSIFIKFKAKTHKNKL